MVGPFKTSKDKKTHLLVAVDKFTKWVEAEPVSKCDAAKVVQFIKKVIFLFGFPHRIITNNGTNLSKGAMKEFCQREHIRLDVSSVAHPSPMVKLSEILRGIKPRLMVPLQRTPGCWVEELPLVLWSINTTPNRSRGYTPFFMVYGVEAVLPSGIRHYSPRVVAYVEADNEQARQDALDLLDEQGAVAAARSAIYQQDLRRYHSGRVKSRTFQEVIWCSGSSRIRQMHTSYPHLGKGPLWSARTCTTGHTTSSMAESTKIHVSQRRRPAGRGI